jgi:glycosyltransferase involved in cell wall biosynthesis
VRILVLAEQWFPDYAGGTARVVRATAEGLVKRGHELLAIVPRCDGQPETELVDGVELRRCLRRGLLPQTATDVYETRRAIGALGRRDFDVVLSHHVGCTTAAKSLRSSAPHTLVFHASPQREASHRRANGLALGERIRSLCVEPLLYLQERYALKHADRILVLSEFSRGLVLEADARAAERIEVVGGGVDTHRFSPAGDRQALRDRLGVAREQKLLVSARRLVSRMGLEMLLRAFCQLHDGDERTRLAIIGEGELLGSLESQREQLGLRGSVRFVGRVSDAELRDWYCAADVFVLPTVAYEGFGMVTAEALACGTPVVGTPVGATAEVLAPLDSAMLAAEASAPALALALRSTLARASEDTRAACRAYAQERLGWERVLDRWEDALAGTIERQARA